MPANELLFIHPLLGISDTWSGFLVESPTDARSATQALARFCLTPTLREFDRRHIWFIPFPCGLVQDGIIENAVYLFDSISAESCRAEEAALRKARFRLGLQVKNSDRLPMTGTWDYVLIGASHARTLPPYTLLGLSTRTEILALDVHNRTDYVWTQENACTLATAEFLQTRNDGGKQADMTRIKLLEMLTLIAEDADTSAIENILRQEPKLSYSLLRLVNSAAMAPRSPITSFAQAINLLGRRQLQRWLQLLIYADPNNGHHPNPLLQKAATRGRLMELLAPSLLPDAENSDDAAFMVGVFSLLHVLLNMSMSEILRHLSLSEMVRKALAEHAGPLGQLLHAINLADSRDLGGAALALESTKLDGKTFLDAQLAALSWASKIHPPPVAGNSAA